ncbi:ABC transporter substrate-binding protein [Aeromicrobium fastidiosum]|uniref:ABC transporter substrate-binding protein n=1 Tax=Aeromicrobium fastidiosum TaxID=52699 RepID=A0A641APP7_9ACTN|nr:ABC transporter substrate-binding protein [Aeromicrobium fastidiosum]KAA1379909.1 ABC transporter substrate-binding protein [Aeromicrobium fastidiosum]MBP2389415.1 peptide/nickel transport system substrate-binding protein [Aeromicrobium fastidiosum]
MNLSLDLLRRSSTIVCLTAIALVLSACGGGGAGSDNGSGKTAATIGTTVQLDSLDPLSSTGGSYTYQQLVHEPLIGFDPETLSQDDSGLAVKYGFREGDPLKFDITLREGVTFSDGEAVDAEAVKASLLRYVAKGSLYGLKGIVGSVDVASPTELTINLTREFAPLPERLSLDGGLIVAPATIKEFPDADALTKAVGAGPYVLEQNRPGVSATFAPNPKYWNKKDGAKLKKLTVQYFADSAAMMNALRTDQIDGATYVPSSDVAGFKGKDDLTVYNRQSVGLDFVYLNWDKPALKDPRVREALSYALDRKTLNDVMTDGYGTPAAQVVPSDSPFYVDDVTTFDHDPAKAEQLLSEAGVKDKVNLDCVWYAGTGWERLLPVVIDQLSKVGVTLKARQLSVAEAIPAYFKPDGADCLLGGTSGTFGVYGALAQNSDSTSFFTAASSDSGVDSALAAFETAYTPEARNAASKGYYEAMLTAAPMILVDNRAKIAVMDKGLKGYAHSPLSSLVLRHLSW